MAEPVATPHTVLIVDDSPELRELLIAGLGQLMHMRILAAESAIAGLEIVERESLSCIVVDIMMPGPTKDGMDGFKFVQIVKGDPQTEAIPIVFLTAREEDVSRFIGLAVGGDNYLVKPVSMRILVGAIEKAIATSPTERRLRLQRLAESEPPRSPHD